MPQPPRRSLVRKILMVIGIVSSVIVLGLIALVVWVAISAKLAPSSESSSSYGLRSSAAGGSAQLEAGMPAPSSARPSPSAAATDTSAPAAVGLKVIKDAEVQLRVADVSLAIEKLSALAGSLGGFVDESRVEENDGAKSGYAVLRVAAPRLDEAVSGAKHLASVVLAESSKSEDVTAAVVDLEARLTSAKAEEAQYLDILKSAKNVDEILSVTEKLSDVRTRIEEMQGQKRYIASQTDFAKLTVYLEEEARVQVPSRNWKPLETLNQSFRGLVYALQGLVNFLIVLAIYGLGFVLPAAVIVWLVFRGVRFIWRKIHRPRK